MGTSEGKPASKEDARNSAEEEKKGKKKKKADKEPPIRYRRLSDPEPELPTEEDLEGFLREKDQDVQRHWSHFTNDDDIMISRGIDRHFEAMRVAKNARVRREVLQSVSAATTSARRGSTVAERPNPSRDALAALSADLRKDQNLDTLLAGQGNSNPSGVYDQWMSRIRSKRTKAIKTARALRGGFSDDEDAGGDGTAAFGGATPAIERLEMIPHGRPGQILSPLQTRKGRDGGNSEMTSDSATTATSSRASSRPSSSSRPPSSKSRPTSSTSRPPTSSTSKSRPNSKGVSQQPIKPGSALRPVSGRKASPTSRHSSQASGYAAAASILGGVVNAPRPLSSSRPGLDSLAGGMLMQGGSSRSRPGSRGGAL